MSEGNIESSAGQYIKKIYRENGTDETRKVIKTMQNISDELYENPLELCAADDNLWDYMRDDDGILSKTEYDDVFAQLADNYGVEISEEDKDLLYKILDTDGNGELSKDEIDFLMYKGKGITGYSIFHALGTKDDNVADYVEDNASSIFGKTPEAVTDTESESETTSETDTSDVSSAETLSPQTKTTATETPSVQAEQTTQTTSQENTTFNIDGYRTEIENQINYNPDDAFAVPKDVISSFVEAGVITEEQAKILQYSYYTFEEEDAESRIESYSQNLNQTREQAIDYLLANGLLTTATDWETQAEEEIEVQKTEFADEKTPVTEDEVTPVTESEEIQEESPSVSDTEKEETSDETVTTKDENTNTSYNAGDITSKISKMANKNIPDTALYGDDGINERLLEKDSFIDTLYISDDEYTKEELGLLYEAVKKIGLSSKDLQDPDNEEEVIKAGLIELAKQGGNNNAITTRDIQIFISEIKSGKIVLSDEAPERIRIKDITVKDTPTISIATQNDRNHINTKEGFIETFKTDDNGYTEEELGLIYDILSEYNGSKYLTRSTIEKLAQLSGDKKEISAEDFEILLQNIQEHGEPFVEETDNDDADISEDTQEIPETPITNETEETTPSEEPEEEKVPTENTELKVSLYDEYGELDESLLTRENFINALYVENGDYSREDLETYYDYVIQLGRNSKDVPKDSDDSDCLRQGLIILAGFHNKSGNDKYITAEDLAVLSNKIDTGDIIPGKTEETATPEPETTPEPTATPEQEITPSVTATPEPEVTPSVTATPEPEATPEPTATPEPEETPTAKLRYQVFSDEDGIVPELLTKDSFIETMMKENCGYDETQLGEFFDYILALGQQSPSLPTNASDEEIIYTGMSEFILLGGDGSFITKEDFEKLEDKISKGEIKPYIEAGEEVDVEEPPIKTEKEIENQDGEDDIYLDTSTSKKNVKFVQSDGIIFGEKTATEKQRQEIRDYYFNDMLISEETPEDFLSSLSAYNPATIVAVLTEENNYLIDNNYVFDSNIFDLIKNCYPDNSEEITAFLLNNICSEVMNGNEDATELLVNTMFSGEFNRKDCIVGEFLELCNQNPELFNIASNYYSKQNPETGVNALLIKIATLNLFEENFETGETKINTENITLISEADYLSESQKTLFLSAVMQKDPVFLLQQSEGTEAATTFIETNLLPYAENFTYENFNIGDSDTSKAFLEAYIYNPIKSILTEELKNGNSELLRELLEHTEFFNSFLQYFDSSSKKSLGSSILNSNLPEEIKRELYEKIE